MPMPVEIPSLSRIEGSGERILIVEDDSHLRALSRALLEKHGYQVMEAANGPEALCVWEQQYGSIDLLLTDMVMPEGMSGRELAEKLRARNAGLRVVFISGYSPDIAGRELSLLERQYFIQKPCSARQLLETIRRCLDSTPSAATPAQIAITRPGDNEAPVRA